MVLSLTGFATMLGMRSTDPMVTTIASDFRVPPETAALLATSCALPFGFCQPVLGPLSDGLGKERVLKACVVALALTLVGGALAPAITWLFASRIVVGLASGGIIPLGLAMIGDRFDVAIRQIAIGRFMAAVLIGQSVGVGCAGILAERVGWRGALGATGAVATLTAVAVFANLRGTPSQERSPPRLAEIIGRVRRVLQNPRSFICYGAVFFEGIAIYGALPYIGEIVEATKVGGPSEAGIIIAGIGIGGILFSVVVARLLSLFGPTATMRVGGVVAGAAYFVFSYVVAERWVAGFACFVGAGFGLFMLHTALQNRATELAPTARASALALHAFFFFLGQGLAPVVFGVCYHRLGVGRAFMLCASMIAATGLISAQLLVRVDRREAQRG